MFLTGRGYHTPHFVDSFIDIQVRSAYPIILWAGAAILGKVGGEMMITDPWVRGLLNPPKWVEYAVMAVFVVFVCGLSKWIANRRKAVTCNAEPAVTDSA